ncbi:RICIN domain-containing protein [Streptomyces sp. NBC_01023]|uniref:RICIN domain-containing protein n=1 Tax=Streptomyces sp. NBC_01023 TaxID=2903724 RepID=UPI003870C806|nr:RICIN domain-containing protein [Streptomyces sp. NBC_01023]
MKLYQKWAAGMGALAISAGLVSSTAATAAASDAVSPTPRSVVAQQLTLRLADDPGQVANVRGGSTENGAPVIQYPWSGKANERWEADSALGGYYRFKSVGSGKCLNVRGGGSENGAQVIQYTCGNSDNELWKFVPKGIGYQVVVKSSGKCLNVRGGVGVGNDLIQYECTPRGVANDVWLPVWEPHTI